ncbi:MAG: hypothetical protein RMJ56_14085 [Gemmataceae bacterium]|nr:peroxiredoxin family protein [Gemmata sp.]MDW8198722.1 hypothetical protein [Gemmataceae bacterium]
MSSGWLAVALLGCGAAPEVAGLHKGDELTYTGTVEEAVERPGMRFRRLQKLEVRLFVLQSRETWMDVAVLTRLRRHDDPVAGAVGTITGTLPEATTPPATRLDLVRVHADGSAHHLVPEGPPPLVLDARTPARALPPLPLDSFAPFEFGIFPPRPPRTAADQPWTIASVDPQRPAETWQVQKTDSLQGERCLVLVMNQQHANWTQPVGGKSAWHRADAVWVSTRDGTTRKVHRVIRHRDGHAPELAAWVEVKYELTARTRVIGRDFDIYRRDIDIAVGTAAEMAPFFPAARKHGPRLFQTRLEKIDAYLNEVDVTSPYREAVHAIRRQLEAAAKGESIAPVAGSTLLAPAASAGRKQSQWPEVGQLAPDFTAGPFRLVEHRGQPVVIVFFQPGRETTDLALAIADALQSQYGRAAAVVALAIWGTVADAEKDRDRRQLRVPIFDGTQAEATLGVESVPRFMLIDSQGRVKWTFCGVGAETGYSLREQLERLLPPTSPPSATGTTRTTVPPATAPLPPP